MTIKEIEIAMRAIKDDVQKTTHYLDLGYDQKLAGAGYYKLLIAWGRLSNH